MKLAEISFDSQCYSNAVNSVTYAGIAGATCGFFCGPFEARKLGLTGGDRAFYEAKSVARYGLRCALFAGFTSVAHYQLKRYWKKDDWVNTCVVGGLAGALVLAASKNLVRTGAHFIAISCVGAGELRKKNDE